MLSFISAAQSAAEAIFSSPAQFPELGGPRSERREAVVRVAKALVYRMDLRSLRVGSRREDGRCVGITVQTIANWTGMTICRVERALAALTRSGYSTSHQPREVVDGNFFGLPAVRTLTKTFFAKLGMALRLELERRRAVKREKERQPERGRGEAIPPVTPGRQAFVEALAAGTAPSPAPGAGPVDEQKRRLWIALTVGLRQKHPDWTADRIRAEATRMLC